MIYKSFLRKKTTKIYILILFLLLFSLAILFYSKYTYRALGNENYANSNIIVFSNEEITDKLQKFKNIKRVQKGIPYQDTDINILFEDGLLDNEIIIDDLYMEEYAIGSTLTLEFGFKTYEWIVKDYHSSSSIFYVSEPIYKEILNNTSKYAYILDLKNWGYANDTTQKLREEYEDVIFEKKSKDNFDYESMMKLFDVFTTLDIIVFIIVFIITIYNILEDEKKNQKMYQKLGFSKRKLRRSSILKCILLILISTFFCFIFSIIFLLNLL